MAEKTQTPNSLDAQREGSFEKKTVPYFSSIAVDLGSVRLPSISFAGRGKRTKNGKRGLGTVKRMERPNYIFISSAAIVVIWKALVAAIARCALSFSFGTP